MSYPQTYPDWHRVVLREEYATTSTFELAERLGRTPATIYSQAKKMGLRKVKVMRSTRSRPDQVLTDGEEEALESQIRAAHDTSQFVQKALAARPAVQVAMMAWGQGGAE